MSKMEYTYEVLSVGEESMDVRYENPEMGGIVVGVRLPFEGESLDAVIDQFSPAYRWAQKKRRKASVSAGVKGTGQVLIEPVSPSLSEADLIHDVRAVRNARLAETDWIYLPDVTPRADIDAWEAYRQALRDVPQQEGFPGEVRWPEAPDS